MTSLFDILDGDDCVALTDVDNVVENLVSDAVSQCDQSAVSISMGWVREGSQLSDEGVTVEMSALETRYSDQFTLSTQLIKPNYLITAPTDACAAPQVLSKLT